MNAEQIRNELMDVKIQINGAIRLLNKVQVDLDQLAKSEGDFWNKLEADFGVLIDDLLGVINNEDFNRYDLNEFIRVANTVTKYKKKIDQ